MNKRRFTTRPTHSGLVEGVAHCDCGWEYDGRNALGLAAQHHARCGQVTYCTISYAYKWQERTDERE